GVEAAGGGRRGGHVLAGVAVAIKSHLGGRAHAPAKLFVVRELARHRGVGNREVIAVAGSHAQRPIGARERRVRGGDARAAEQAVEKAARPAGGVLAVSRAAIVLSERYQDAAALPFAFAAVALQSLDVGHPALYAPPHF